MVKTSKVMLAALAVSLSNFSYAQSTGQTPVPVPTPHRVVERGSNHKVWQWETYEVTPDGKTRTHIHKYTELATGLNYKNANGQWVDSKPEIDILPDGTAAAIHGQHQAYFPSDIAQGAIKVVTPDGDKLQSRPIGLSYDDGSNTVFIALLTNSVGELVASNQIIYPNAFDGASASLRYTYTKAGFEQDVLVQGQLPAPESYGLNPATTRLQVLTEFFNVNDPGQTALSMNARDRLRDTTLTFGKMKMIRGKAFSIGQSNSRINGTPTYKSWVRVNGREFLVEQVPYARLAAQLSQLPPVSQATPSANGILNKVSAQRLLPPVQVVQAGTNHIQMAEENSLKNCVALDYVSVDSSLTDFTFQGDMTYFISGQVWIMGNTTFESGTVLKYSDDANSCLIPDYQDLPDGYSLPSSLTYQTGSYRPIVLTSMDDNTVGETISGSTGSPTINGDTYILFQGYAEPTPWVSNVHASYAGCAIDFEFDDGGVLIVSDSQFVNCTYAITSVGPETILKNDLFSHCYIVANIDGDVQAIQVTADQSWNFINDYGYIGCCASVELTNSILSSVTNMIGLWNYSWYSYNIPVTLQNSLIAGTNNRADVVYSSNSYQITNLTGIYQTAGGGNYYLATNSIYRDAGTTNIDPGLLADLATKTTYPPIIYSNTAITNTTTLSPQAQRDTNTPDLGYHYDPLDYILGGCDLLTNMTLTAGAAIGWYDFSGNLNSIYTPYGILLGGLNKSSQGVLTSEGTVTQPCWIVQYNTVQENAVWANQGQNDGILLIEVNENGSVHDQINTRFTKWSSLAGLDGFIGTEVDNSNAAVTCLNNEFYSGSSGFGVSDSLYFTNCLFDRAAVYWYSDGGVALNFALENCTFYGGSVNLSRWDTNWPSSWIIKNTTFDGTAFITSDGLNGDTNYTTFDYNAYNSANTNWEEYASATGTLETVGPHDVTVTDGYNWQSSWLGDFYLPSDSPLIYAGSTMADQVGLFEFTTQTNQQEEGTSTVDIGYHYVATDGSGSPLETFTNGVPDYIVDANGNGLPDWWEWYWFGNYTNSASEVDANGNTLLSDYQNDVDPNPIRFLIPSSYNYVNHTNVSVQLTLTAGAPSYYAIFFKGSTTTNWLPFTGTNFAVNLGSTDGVYDVVIGLKGLPAEAQQTWDSCRFILDRVPPVVTITNPALVDAASTVIKPYLQLQGYANEQLSALSYDISNAMGVATNLNAFVTDQYFDTNAYDFTTNYFQAYDVPLTNGVNNLTLRVSDRAGNLTTTNFNVTLDYSGATNPPVVTLTWPQDGMAVSGTNTTIRGTMSDETGTIVAQVVNGDGTTNLINGLVERNHQFWVENVPLNGTNQISIQATDAAGNVTTTNITIISSVVELAITGTPTGDNLYQPFGSVYGTVGDSTATVVVNGVTATVYSYENSDGTYSWGADNVPINGGGTATFDASASSNSGGGSGSGDGGAAPEATATAEVEKGPAVEVVQYSDGKSIDSVSINAQGDTSTSTMSWGKGYGANYSQGEPQSYAGEVNQYNTWSDAGGSSWSDADYVWSGYGDGEEVTGGGDTGSYDDYYPWISSSALYDGVITVPDPDCFQIGQQGQVPPGWLYHYFASGVDYTWDTVDGYGGITHTELTLGAHIQVKLYTGGKAKINLQNLFCVNAWATAYGKAPNGPWLGTPISNIDPTSLTVLGKHPDTNGNVYIILPDNSEQDTTVFASAKHYDAWATPTKYKSHFDVFVRQPFPSYPNDAGWYGPYGPPVGWPVYDAVTGKQAGHAWWKLTTEAPIDLVKQFANANAYQWVNTEVGYAPIDDSLISLWPLTEAGPGELENDNGSPDVHRVYSVGFQGPGVIDGLNHTEDVYTNPGTWNSSTHNCVHETVTTGNAAGKQLSVGDATPEGFGFSLPPDDP